MPDADTSVSRATTGQCGDTENELLCSSNYLELQDTVAVELGWTA